MRTADLTGALLDYWVARAEGVPADQLEIRHLPRPGDPRTPDTICVRRVRGAGPSGMWARVDYSTNWALTGPLLEKHGVDLEERGGFWTSYKASKHGGIEVTECSDPLIAICRAVVRAAFGDEVEDLPNA